MVVATMLFTLMQGAIRIVANDPSNPLPALEVAFFRNLFGLLVLLPALLGAGIHALKTDRIKLHFARSAVQAGGMLCFFYGVTLIPLTEVTALSFSAPLFATLLAVVVLGERVRLRRISALIVGFVGVLIVLRPGVEAVSLGAALILLSSSTWAVGMTMIKVLSKTESALSLTLYAALFMTPITLIPALWVWQQPNFYQLAWMLAIGAAGSAGHIAFARAFKVAEMSAVLPLDFLRLVWASLFGFLVFSEIPTIWSWTGGLLIFSAASYIAFREAKLKRQEQR